MNPEPNEKKELEIATSTGEYSRRAVKTHFVSPGEDYIELFKKYVEPYYEEGDIVSVSEKIIALCQNRIVRREDMHISAAAKFLSKFASHPDYGIGVGETIKMQFAIDQVGLPKVLFASAAGAITKLFGKKGVFYEIVGQEVSGLDGFYDHVWSEYRDIGIMIPENPSAVCNEVKNTLGITCMIVDANDIGQEILGKSDDIKLTDKELIEIIADNPAGQGRQCTPFILVHKSDK
ncbi:MAG: coenzyme F420-0:L-glutamate ligase [Clostridiales bacterium]|nr:coenzyme F420-0:L-glutamate ligase [Clostridiales bacterium]